MVFEFLDETLYALFKAGLHYQSFCDRSLSANTVLDEHQSNRRL